MRKYHPRTATPPRLDYGIELIAGLGMFDETKPLAAPFEELNERLDQAFTTRRNARKPLVVARAKLRVANYLADTTIRSLARASELADGGRRGPVHDALFPSGVTPVVAPAGAAQVEPLKSLRDRMARSELAGLATLRDEWGPKLAAALDALTQASSAYDAAKSAYLDAFGKEIALRDAHLLAVDSIMGHVRALYPRDRVKQDVIFPEVEGEHHGGDAAEDPEDAAAQGA